MLAVIDYGAGNLRSVLHALNFLGATNIRVARAPYELRGADKIILPGVGAFGAGMERLRAQDLVQAIRDAVIAGTPYLGICLGMQFLFERSDEMGVHEGIGLLPGEVTRLNAAPGLKVPHMGWNRLQARRESALLNGVSSAGYAYFVHSYHCVPARDDDILATVDYDGPVVAAVQRDHIYGVQFHPEKSQRLGLQILSNFLEL
ncbi:MAG: imidazole glycerol phosphate synthase subunit HisH [Chloroflexota bacterium]|nr:MAG: imidazole glycerol phosphate synthase subunit HisH [Chloroflexota bacterium]